jgi:hypothetical protein
MTYRHYKGGIDNRRCPACGIDLPAFNELILAVPPTGVKVVTVTITVICACGSELDLIKKMRNP